MRYLLLSSLLLTLYCCAPSARKAAITSVDRQVVTVFSDTSGAYLYKNKIDLFGHYLSGLMMIKPMGNHNYKVAIATEFGAKILDFEITDGVFKLNDCIEEMQRKVILTIVESDMKMLLGAQLYAPKLVKEVDGKKLIQFRTRPFNTLYSVGTEGKVLAIEGYRLKRRLVQIKLSEYEGAVPKHITVEHFGMPVHIDLTIIKYPGSDAE
jgi:hypothetical protein